MPQVRRRQRSTAFGGLCIDGSCVGAARSSMKMLVTASATTTPPSAQHLTDGAPGDSIAIAQLEEVSSTTHRGDHINSPATIPEDVANRPPTTGGDRFAGGGPSAASRCHGPQICHQAPGASLPASDTSAQMASEQLDQLHRTPSSSCVGSRLPAAPTPHYRNGGRRTQRIDLAPASIGCRPRLIWTCMPAASQNHGFMCPSNNGTSRPSGPFVMAWSLATAPDT